MATSASSTVPTLARSVYGGLGICVLAVAGACTDAADRSPDALGDAGPPPDAQPLPPLPSTCEAPSRPAPLGRDVVVGDGTAPSCTRDALQTAVEEGGNVTFDCGASPVTISVTSQVHVAADSILDGGGLVTLDGGGTSRILSVDNHVSLTAIGLTFTRGLATSTGEDRASGGAIRGGWRGTVSVFDCVFAQNVGGSEGEEGGGRSTFRAVAASSSPAAPSRATGVPRAGRSTTFFPG